MTIHAAKGLEWDVVAVPGLVERVFPTGKSRSHWVTGAAVLPFACRGDSDDLPVLRRLWEDRGLRRVQGRVPVGLAMTRSDGLPTSPSPALATSCGCRRTLDRARGRTPCATSRSSRRSRDRCARGRRSTNGARCRSRTTPNPILADGVLDVAWPAVPDRAEMPAPGGRGSWSRPRVGALRPMVDVAGDDGAIAVAGGVTRHC